MPLPCRRAPPTVAAAKLARSSSWAGFHASRESVPLPPIWDKEKAVRGGASPAAPAASLCDGGFHASRDPVPFTPTSDLEKTASTAVPAKSLAGELSKADAIGPYACSGWSDLPNDLLTQILNLLELPEALAFRAVCPSWRSASTSAATSVPPRCTPWLVSLAAEPGCKLRDLTVSSKFSNLLHQKTFQVSFSWGQTVTMCGASHGWLIMANKLSDLILYDPFTAALIPLPPITSFDSCIEGAYEGKTLVGYRFGPYQWSSRVYDTHTLGCELYDKVVLSGSPSAAGRAFALAIYLDGKRLSLAKVGGSRWRQVSRIRRTDDSFADCVYHCGRFYVVAMKGRLKCLDFARGPGEMSMTTVIAEDDDDDDGDVITRYLVSAPWGGRRLLQVRVILDKRQVNKVRVEVDRLDRKSQKMVQLSPAKALWGHSVFVGQNSPGLLSTKEFPELKPDCIYFTTPRLMDYNLFYKSHNQWNGVKVYDLKKRTLEPAFPSGVADDGILSSLNVWFTPSR